VDHAQRLAIRVVPEFDNPGHSRAIGLDPYFTEIVRCFNKTDVYPLANAYSIRGTPLSAPLDPSMDKTYEYIQGLLSELDTLFPDSMLHLGGDEIDTECFDENPKIQSYMTKMNIANYSELIVAHIAKVRSMVSKINPKKRAIYWSGNDTFYQRYRENDILMYWGFTSDTNNTDEFFKKYPNQTYVLTPVDYFYLDCSFGNKYGGESWCDPMKTWARIYSFEPSDYNNGGKNILGTAVPVWSEIMSDQSVHQKIWPRAGAMADKLWGNIDTDTNYLVGVAMRQISFAQFITARGIPATHITGRWCEIYP
jgi:hexosaminidase